MRMPFGVERMMYGCAPVCAGAAVHQAAMAAATVETSKKPRRVISIGNLALDNSPLRSSILTPVVAKIEAA